MSNKIKIFYNLSKFSWYYYDLPPHKSLSHIDREYPQYYHMKWSHPVVCMHLHQIYLVVLLEVYKD